MPPVDPGAVGQFIQLVGFPAAVAVGVGVLAYFALRFQHKEHIAELARIEAAKALELKRIDDEHARELRDKDAAAQAWKQMYELANSERQANGRELAEQLKTLDIALELVHKQRSAR